MSKMILFYGQHLDYPEFSNFYPASMTIKGKTYATVEHYFQACKTKVLREHERVRTAATPAQAKHLGRKVALRPDWERVKTEVMRRALMAKFTQHQSLLGLLVGTGDAVIHEASPSDAIWGWMGGSGQDLLGKILMEVRTAIKKGQK